ncbi:MAG: hypothetical protein JSU73_00570 [candidate division WOR-3 bacterium]|nr:MAG: hypothetical protein JSU73_00570 [candidate division WOR-3 bacterium]
MSRRSPILFLTILVVGVAVAQHWEFEQVDSLPAGWGVGIRRRPDGGLQLCYSTSQPRAVWFAFKDSIWHREIVDTFDGAPSFDVSQDGKVAMVYAQFLVVKYAVRTDTGWVTEEVTRWGLSPKMSFDLDNSPFVLYASSYPLVYAAWRTDSGWISEVAVPPTPGLVGEGWCSFGPAAFDSGNHPWVCAGEDVEFNSQLWWGFVHLRTKRDTWEEVWTVGGSHRHSVGLAVAVDPLDAAVPCYYLGPEGSIYVSSEVVEQAWALQAALRFDEAGQPHVAYPSVWEGVRYAYRTSLGWHVTTVDTGWAACCDFVLSDDGQPIVAYCRSDGVWLAKGEDVVGVAQQIPVVVPRSRDATIVRGSLSLPGSSSSLPTSSLLDATGRKVVDLRPGENDIRHVAPGVYFVRSAGSGERSAVSVRKVVVQR